MMRGTAVLALAGVMLTSASAGQATPMAASDAAVKTTQAETDALVRQVGQAWLKREWEAYRERFVSADGRVVDNGNNGISHSEGQGYALLLAAIVRNEADFTRLWRWTEQHLYVRPDGLAAWKWDPKSGAVADSNNATDGDLLIAWALVRAARAFNQPHYADRARVIAEALGKAVVIPSEGGPVLLPGAFGFRAGDQPDGPVVNLSYYVFPALDALRSVAPAVDWAGIAATGLRLIEDSRFGPLRLPSDWVSLATHDPKPAEKFPKTFGYDAIRIPLYLAWGARAEAAAPRFAGLWNPKRDSGPFVTDLVSGAAVRPIDGAGFRLIATLSACLGRNGPVPDDLVSSRDDLYYPATLRLLCLAVIEERYAQCL